MTVNEGFRRYYLIIAFLAFIFGCDKQKNNSGNTSSFDSSVLEDTSSSGAKESKDAVVLSQAQQILSAIKNKDYQRFAAFIHPTLGVRFSPYGYIDTLNHVKLNQTQFLQQVEDGKEIKWGSYDGTGKEIILTVREYFGEFVYDVDFLNAEKTSMNEMIGRGNSLNNLEGIYPGSDFIEKHFSGFDKKHDGMDWRSLRLVFQRYQGKPFLVAIVHDQWTI